MRPKTIRLTPIRNDKIVDRAAGSPGIRFIARSLRRGDFDGGPMYIFSARQLREASLSAKLINCCAAALLGLPFTRWRRWSAAGTPSLGLRRATGRPSSTRVHARIEKIFGTWKRCYGLRRMRWRGLAKATAQVHLTAIAYNLKLTRSIVMATV